jgi:hypothetical protein
MAKTAQLKRQSIEKIDRYFTGAETTADLHAWTLTQSLFASPKELDNSEDWIIANALALMRALADTTEDRSTVENELRRARRFLSGEEPFPEDYWPIGLIGQRSEK